MFTRMDGLPAGEWALGPGALEEPGRGARGPPTVKLQDSLCIRALGSEVRDSVRQEGKTDGAHLEVRPT